MLLINEKINENLLIPLCSHVKYPVFGLRGVCVEIPNKTGIKVKKLKSIINSMRPHFRRICHIGNCYLRVSIMK